MSARMAAQEARQPILGRKTVGAPRERQTRPGSALEAILLNRLERVGLPRPEVQYRIVPGRRWRWDLAWPTHRLAVEVQGGIYTGGRHVRGAGYEADAQKRNAAQLLCWRCICCLEYCTRACCNR